MAVEHSDLGVMQDQRFSRAWQQIATSNVHTLLGYTIGPQMVTVPGSSSPNLLDGKRPFVNHVIREMRKEIFTSRRDKSRNK